jgi:hypothetical protein
MRLGAIAAVCAGLLSGCTTGPEPGADVAAACERQGHDPGTEAWRVCIEADGAAIATGPGSPFANADEDMGPDG